MYFDYSDEITEHRTYYLGKYTAKFLSKIVYREVRVNGAENIPSVGPLIIACNHIAFSDPAIIVANCPRTVHFMAKSELFENPATALFMKHMNAFPVKRNHSDRKALRYAKIIIENGFVLGIFPEGRRVKNSSPDNAKTGVAYLARLTGADVLPACLYRNADDNGLYHSLSLTYGKVIKNCELGFKGISRGEGINNAAEIIMNRITELWVSEDEYYRS